MFDISGPSTQQACEAGHTFEPVWPGTSKGIGATITVRGPHSDAIRQHAEGAIAQARDRAMVTRGAQQQATVEQLEQQLIDTAVAYTMGWGGIAEAGTLITFSPEAARRFYRAQPWIREQVLEQGRDLGNFVKPCLPSSSSTSEPSSTST